MPEATDRKHVAVLAFPFATHAAPLLSLILRINSHSPPDTTIFSFFSTKASNETTFAKIDPDSLHNIKVFDVYDGLTPDFVSSGNPLEFVSLFLGAMPGNFQNALKEAEEIVGVSYSCLVTDAFYWFGADIARNINTPWVPVWTSGPRSLLTHIETDAIRETFANSGKMWF